MNKNQLGINNKYYVGIDHDGFNQEAYLNAFKFANKLARQDNEVKRIVCYVHTKGNIGYFEPFFDARDITRFLEGNVRVDGFRVPLTIETKITYAKSRYSSSNCDIVLAFGMDLEDLEILDDYYGIKYIVAIPWLKHKTVPWAERWGAQEITGKGTQPVSPSVSSIVKVALEELSSSINMSTGISHPMDNDLAKTYIRALHKYEPVLKAEDVVSYLVKELGWSSAHANDIGKLINTLNEGRSFRGGEKTGLQNHYKWWRDKARESKA